MDSETLKAMRELDEAAEKAGGYVINNGSKVPHYDYRKLLKYCREKGKDPRDMTIRELDCFIIPQ